MRIREVLINGDEFSRSEKEGKKNVMIIGEEEMKVEEMKKEMEKIKKKRKIGVLKEMNELFGCKRE